MNEIYRFKKDLHTNFKVHKTGTRWYRESDPNFADKFIFHPIDSAAYPIWENSQLKFIDEYLEFEQATEKSKEYYTKHVICYTQEQLDQMAAKEQTNTQ